jgi:hypothetical protein
MRELKLELQQSIAAIKKTQTVFEKVMIERQEKYEVKLEKITMIMKKDLSIANKNIAKLHEVVQNHATEEFIENRLAANTNGLIAWLQQNVACRQNQQSVEENPSEYMHIDNEETIKRKSFEMIENIQYCTSNAGEANKCYP